MSQSMKLNNVEVITKYLEKWAKDYIQLAVEEGFKGQSDIQAEEPSTIANHIFGATWNDAINTAIKVIEESPNTDPVELLNHLRIETTDKIKRTGTH